MTDSLKYIVVETNKLIKSDYNLISFDSLSVENLLQLLVDIFVHLNAATKFDVRETDPEETNKRIIESLKKIQYRPTDIDPSDPGAFRRNLLQGNRKTIYPILKYIYENQDHVLQLSYLAKYLYPLELPPEALAIPEINNLWTQYHNVMENFKESHKTYRYAVEEGSYFKELKNDIGAIDIEIENVKKRIDRTQSRLDKVPQQELLLESTHALRIERDRQKELQHQMDEQKQALQKAALINERLRKELQNAQIATQGASPAHLLETLVEETQVLEFMVKQKLPQELIAKQMELQIMQDVINENNISNDYLDNLQKNIDEASKEVQTHIESRMAERGTQNDMLGPFRQQASMVARNKDMAVEQLDQVTQELREIETVLQQKQQQLQETVGEVILRGDELKQYVNTLRAKSSVYKQQRAELAAFKSEATDLNQTLENLKMQDPTLSSSLSQIISDEENKSSIEQSRSTSPIETRSIVELTRIVDGLGRAVSAARERVTPLSQKLRLLRGRMEELKEERNGKKQSYDSLNATLNAESTAMQAEIVETERNIEKMENNWQLLKMEYERAELLLAKATEDSDNGDNGTNLKETLNEQIKTEETLISNLRDEKQNLNNKKENREKQHALWSNVLTLLNIKAECLQDNQLKGPGGIFSIDKKSETFTLN